MLYGLIEKYILRTLTPYFIFALLFLTTILLFQQFSRLSSIYPTGIWAGSNSLILLYAFLPKTLTFTLPMATLISVLLAVSKLKAESELIALQSSGLSHFRLFKPIAVFAISISIVCFYLNLYISPEALVWIKDRVKSVTQEDIASLIDIGTFNNDLKDLNIYIREGNSARGEWRGLFITRIENKQQRVITAKSGTLDFDGKRVELVLKDVTSLKFLSEQNAVENEGNSVVLEKLQYLRFEIANNLDINERKDALSEKLNYEETSSRELFESLGKSTTEKNEIIIQLQRRTALSFSPLVLAFLGFFAALAFGRGGKAFGLILSLMFLLSYYLLFLSGEQLSRMGALPVYIGGWLANLVLPICAVLLTRVKIREFAASALANPKGIVTGLLSKNQKGYNETKSTRKVRNTNTGKDDVLFVPIGVIDKNVLSKVILFLLLTYITFVSLFFIFTFFELWKSIFSNNVPASIVAKYLLYLLPLVTVQVLGPCMLVAGFVAFLLMVNRNETVIWLVAGVGIYRLLLPVLIASSVMVSLHWWIQERIMPQSNVAQDSLRGFIKTGFPRTAAPEGRQWLAVNNVIFNYEYDVAGTLLKKPVVYALDDSFIIKEVLLAGEGKWNNGELQLNDVLKIDAASGSIIPEINKMTVEGQYPSLYFNTSLARPFYLTTYELKKYIEVARVRGEDTTQLNIAYHRRFSDPFSVLIFSLYGVCTALLFSKHRTFLQIIVAVALGISVIVLTQIITNAGVLAGLPIVVACWSPYILFSAVSIYMVASLKT